MSRTRPSDRTILIAGPTASGKSALALALAGRLGGVVINADSMQVYRELRILTARPSDEDEARAPHRLYGHVPASEAYSAGRFVREAAIEIAGARSHGLVPIVVGGTGLYFKALLEGLSPIPPVADEIRTHWRRLEQERGASALWDILNRDDPEMAARLAPNDSQRIVRALEVLDATGRSLADWQRTPGVPVVPAEATVRFVVSPDIETLDRRIDTRFDAMMAEGAVDEVARLLALGLDPALPAMRALGVRPLAQMLAGSLSRDAAVAQAQTETRQFTKRQRTWLRGHMMSWNWLLTQQMESQMAESMMFIDP
ncbi:MAG: tRNA (adenosine(37)-N6)-dimethylallyltransferase MiaA [Hyphomicrobium sp.]|nr:tRNA (adenosine(37)-N6)-dimethylallyltransferase MiaA [Hyphomicrobium sp.]PPC80283.1 MAG: tRNA (adenosine(37)-N6)-dimethylallyltransferase MiaA [Hyphomicrobium sp.]